MIIIYFITLLQTIFDLAYSTVVDFENIENQKNYFDNLYHKTFSLNIKGDAFRTELLVPCEHSLTLAFDYCYITGLGGKRYYYFITDRQIKSKSTTLLTLKLDVFQTYMFQYDLGECYVDRCHVPRWTNEGLPTLNVEDEGIQPTNYINTNKEHIKKLENTIVYVTSEPIEWQGSSPPSPSSGNWQQGIASKEMYRYLKGWEGFAPYEYQDSGGVWTIGYGVTKSEPTVYNNLKANEPCSEELCALSSWDLLEKNYGKPIVDSVKSIGCTEQRQFDALLDLAYNAGTDVVINSQGNRELVNTIKLNPNDESAIRPVWENYIIKDANGTVQPGLVQRRKDECDMYFGKSYEVRSIPIIGQDGSITGIYEGDGWLPY